MLKIVGEGTMVKVEVPEGATLEDVLGAANMEYCDDMVYRTVGGMLNKQDKVPSEGVLVYAAAEDNGL